jgi:hypothetical protein
LELGEATSLTQEVDNVDLGETSFGFWKLGVSTFPEFGGFRLAQNLGFPVEAQV